MNVSPQLRLKLLHADGLTCAEIARYLDVPDRNIIRRNLLALKLKPHVKSLAELRRKAFGSFATSLGWPAELRPRAVQVLELLLAEPALTRRQICERLGLRWKSCRRNGLQSNPPYGTYPAELIAAGLVAASPRLYFGGGKGRSCRVYSATPLALQMKSDFLRRKNHGETSELRPGDNPGLAATVPAGRPPAETRPGQADRRTSRRRR